MKKNDFSRLDKKTCEALERLIALFNEETYEWLAGLWEPEIGGFYYSNSGRDYEGFLPDIESTVQALNGLRGLGMFDDFDRDYKKALPESMQQKLLCFATGLQDEGDGFFYHPQWGKDITLSRRARDNGWATQLIRALGGSFRYPLATERIKQSSASAPSTPPHLKSREKFLEYLTGFDLRKTSYHSGNMIASQHAQIKAAGLEKMCLDYFTEWQDPQTGAWEDHMCYNMTNGLMKISGFYVSAGREFPNAEAAIDTAIAGMFMEEKPRFVTDVYNPLVAASGILSTLRKAGKDSEADRLLSKIVSRAAELIDVTAEKIALFRKAGGCYSYELETTSPTSQGAPVALKVAEGDVNATMIAVSGTAMGVMRLLGVPDPGLYDHEDYDRFMKIIEMQRTPLKKQRP